VNFKTTQTNSKKDRDRITKKKITIIQSLKKTGGERWSELPACANMRFLDYFSSRA